MAPDFSVRVRFCIASVAFAVSVAAFPSAARADDASDLLAQHKAFVGWTMGDGTFKSLVADGTIVRSDKGSAEAHIADLHTVRVGLAYRTTASYSGSVSYQGFTGSKFWYSTDSGFVVPLVTDDRFDILARGIVFGEAITQLPAVVRRHDTVEGVNVVVLRQTPPKGSPVDLYIDPQTGALKRFVIDPDGDADPIDIDAYTEVLPRKRVISAYHTVGSTRRTRYTEIHANAAHAEADLAPPPARARWTFAKAAPIPIKVTDNRIYVNAKVNGIDGKFILDTGSDGIAFTDAFADRIKFDRSNSISFGGIAGSKRGSAAEVASITFGDGSKLEKVVAESGIDMNHEADGLIGFEFFAGAIVDLDFDHSQMTLYDPSVTAPNESSGIVVNADLGSGSPIIPVKLNGSVPSRALLDSGAAGDVLIAPEFQHKLKMLIDPTSLSSVEVIGGVSGGAEEDRCGMLDSIVIGPITYQATRACYSYSLARNDSIVGIHFLKAFNITFDYPDAKLVLSPRK
jgi:predicted aspartyl protease